MNSSNETIGMEATKARLSRLWLLVILNMIAIDVLSLFIPGVMEEMAAFVGDTPIPLFMLVAGILIEIPLLMTFLSRSLPYGANRWANIIAAVVTIVYVVGGGSTYPHYIFMGAVEVVCLLLIIWTAWRWPTAGA